MATSLTGLNVNTTYDALIKVGDNGVVGGTLKQVSDGFGNEFPMQISTTQVVITGSLSGSATSAISASFATTASFVRNAVSASFASTASFVINASTASLALTSSTTITTANESFQVAIVSASSASPIYRNVRLTYNASSNLLTNQGEIAGDLITSTGNVAAGANISATGTGTFTGRLTANGAITTTNITASVVSASSGFTGSLFGTSSWATNALTASFLPIGTYNITASWAQSASNAINARTASFVNNLNQNLSITGAVILSGSSLPELQVIGETQFTGSVSSLNGFTGSLFGTSSWALNVVGGGGGVTINNNTDGNVITATGTANTLDGEINLTFSSSILTNKVRSNFGGGTLVANTSHQIRGYSAVDTFAYFLVQDQQGDDTIKVSGDISAGTSTVTIGDVSTAVNGTYVQVEDSSSKISLEGKVFAKSIRVPDTALTNQGQFHAGATVADTWSSTGPTLTSGRVVYISGSGQWAEAVASSDVTSTGVLGVVTTTANQNEILLHGVVRVSQSLAGFTNGSPVYLATSSAGTITQTAPSTVGHVARYVGYVLDSGSRQIYFNPDFTWIEL